MNRSTGLVGERKERESEIVPKRPLDTNPNGGRSAQNRLVEEGSVGWTNTTHNRGLEDGRGVIRGTSKGHELDALLLGADRRGVYKRFLVWWWLVPVCLLVPCAHLNIMLMVYLPPSNCTLPAPPPHLSRDAWRSLATPRNPTGELNTCALYDFPSALKDFRYDPGIHGEHTTSTSDDTHGHLQDLGISTDQPITSQKSSGLQGNYKDVPGTSEDTSTTGGDTDALRSFPGTPQDTSLLEKDSSTFDNDHGDLGKVNLSQDTSKSGRGIHEHAPVSSGQPIASGKDATIPKEAFGLSEQSGVQQPIPVNHPSIQRHDTGNLAEHYHRSQRHTGRTKYTQDQSSMTPEHPNIPDQHFSTSVRDSSSQGRHTSTPGDASTRGKHLDTTVQNMRFPAVSSTLEQQLSETKPHFGTSGPHFSDPADPSTPEKYQNVSAHKANHQDTNSNVTNHTNTSYPDLTKSRVARYFDPFNKLFDHKMKGIEGGQSRPKHDPLGEYLRAAMTWQELHPEEAPPANYTMGCVFGHDFDRTYVQETLSTQFGWTCGEEQGITRILHTSMAGNLVGCIFFGALADRAGRKPVFLTLAVMAAVLGSCFVLVRGPWVLLLLRFLVALGLPAIYQIVIITVLEQVRDGERGLVTCLSSVCFSLGQCLLALLAWLTGNWVTLGLVTSLPAILAFVYIRLVEESPRWLVSRGKMMEAARVLQRITRRNIAKSQQPPSISVLRGRIRKITTSAGGEGERQVKRVCRGNCGFVTNSITFLLTFPRLSFRVILVTVCWTVNLVLYFTSTLKYPHVSENPYLGWFFTSVTEVPANLLVIPLLRCLGRRALHSSGLAVSSAAFLVGAALLAVGYKENFAAVTGLVLVAKFCSSMTFLVVYLQAAELHPTPIRSFVTGLASLIALSANIFSPSILAMSQPFHAYLLLGLLGVAGTLSAILLPETAGRPLPQTLSEAENLTWRNRVVTTTTTTTTPTNTTPTTTNTEAQRENDRRLPTSFEEDEEDEEDDEDDDEDDDDEDEDEDDEDEEEESWREGVGGFSSSPRLPFARQESVL